MRKCKPSSSWPRAVPVHIHSFAGCEEQERGPTSEAPVVGEIKHGQLMHAPHICRGDLISGSVQLDEVLAQAEDVAQHSDLVACREGHLLESTCAPSTAGLTPARPSIRMHAHTHTCTRCHAHWHTHALAHLRG